MSLVVLLTYKYQPVLDKFLQILVTGLARRRTDQLVFYISVEPLSGHT